MKLIIITMLIFFSTNIFAQPSDAQVKKDVNGPGILDITFAGKGTLRWNGDIMQNEYGRAVHVTRNSEYPGIKLVVSGDAVYRVSGNSYTYWKFRTVGNNYLGIPNPTEKEINEILSKNWKNFYGGYYGDITKLYGLPVLAESPDWLWHTPKSVEFKMKFKCDYIVSGTEIETAEMIRSVRLYADEIKGPWKSIMASEVDDKPLGRQQYTVAQIDKMRKQTLEFTLNEQVAQQQQSKMPQVNIPAGANSETLLKILYATLRTGTENELRAVLIKMLSSQYFEKGSKVQLNDRGEQLVKEATTLAYKGDVKFADVYCQTPQAKQQPGSKTWYLSTCLPDKAASTISFTEETAGFAEGVEKNEWKIFSLSLIVNQEEETLAYLKSFSDKKKLCPNDGASTTLANNTNATTNNVTATDNKSTTGNWQKGDKVMVKELLKWYPAEVLDTRPGEWFIHYDGYDAKYDLWVDIKRIKNR